MESYIRLALLGLGALIIFSIVFDGFRRARSYKLSEKTKQYDLTSKDRLDSFDSLGKCSAYSVDQFDAEVFYSSAIKTQNIRAPLCDHFTDHQMDEDTEPAIEGSLHEVQKVKISLNAAQKSKLIVLHIMSKHRPGFSGKALLEAMNMVGLDFENTGIFHRYEQGNPCIGLQFCIAQAIEPGTFDRYTLEHSTTPGIVMFLTIPGPRSPMHAFDEMLRIARTLSARLRGELQDSLRVPLANQTIQDYRQMIREFETNAEFKRYDNAAAV